MGICFMSAPGKGLESQLCTEWFRVGLHGGSTRDRKPEVALGIHSNLLYSMCMLAELLPTVMSHMTVTSHMPPFKSKIIKLNLKSNPSVTLAIFQTLVCHRWLMVNYCLA